MDISIHEATLPHEDADATLGFSRVTPGFEVHNDVEYGGMHWITVGPPDQRYGIRDGALRDPSGNLVRIREVR